MEPSKAVTRTGLNKSLLAIAIGVFFLTINLKSELLSNKLLSLQFILSIPLLTTSILAYAKIGYRQQIGRWNFLGWSTFTIGYALLFNVIGILISEIIGVFLAIVFFITIWALTIIYSVIDVSYRKTRLKERILKDSLFIGIQILLGLFIVLKIYGS
jgi:hypothetical protein